MRIFMAICIALAFAIAGALIVTFALTIQINATLGLCQFGFSLCLTGLGTVLLINYKDA